MKRLPFTLLDAQEHARKNGYVLEVAGKAPGSPVEAQKPPRGARQPNKTEAEYGRILESAKQRTEIYEYAYEAMTLRWGDGMRYTPDWVTFHFPASNHGITVIEVKGGHIFDRDLVRFKGCRAEWKDRFFFEMWQKKAGEWRRLL